MLVVGVLGAAVIAGYALALWWLLRGERAWTVAALTALCGVSLALRLVLSQGYPFGLAEDEPKFLACTLEAVGRGEIASESCIHIPYLLPALFEVPLVPLVGLNRWSIRAYTTVTSVLAVPALFAAARALGLAVAPGLFAAGLVAVLPWSIYYGRISLGGELIFHQALLIAALAGLIWRKGGWREAVLGGFALCLLLWDYWAGRSMVGMPLVAAVLARGARRAWAVAVLAIAVAGWVPHLLTGPKDAQVGLSFEGAHGAVTAGSFNEGFAHDPVATLQNRTHMAFEAFTGPYAFDSIFTMRTVAWHPWVVLGLAALGLLTGVRRGLFLLAGFVAGIAPGIASGSFGISAHRIMMAYGFVALSAASAVNLLPWRALRRGAAALLWAGIAVWSVSLYFSDRFWLGDLRWGPDGEKTALAEAIAAAAPAHVIWLGQFGFWSYAAGVSQADVLTLDNWLPAQSPPTTYAFTAEAAPLRPQYERLFPGRVRPVGRQSFLVQLEQADRDWVRQYGWWYEVRCQTTSHVAQVPFLYSLSLGVGDLYCLLPATHVWRAHWTGPATSMQLAFSGQATITTAAGVVHDQGQERQARFPVPADSDVVIELALQSGDVWPLALLTEDSPGGWRVPNWESFRPLPPAQPDAAAVAP